MISELDNQGKKISLVSATLLCVTCMIGSGWLFSAQLNARLAGNYAIIAWWIAAAFALLVGFSFMPAAKAFPVRGAIVRCTSLSHNSLFGLPFAFANWFGILVATSTEAQASAQYIAGAFGHDVLITSGGSLTAYGKLLGSVILMFYLLINYFGVKLLTRLNNPLTVLKMVTPILLIVLLLCSHFDRSNFHIAANSHYDLTSLKTAILGAGLVYAFNGFQVSLAYASEIKNPGRNIALSMVLGIVVVAIVFSVLQFAFMGAIPHAMIMQSGWASLNFSSPLVQLTLLLGMHVMATILLADSIFSPSATGYVYLGASARMIYAMSHSKQMPKSFSSTIHPKFNLCRRSVAISFALALVFLWVADSWSELMLVVTAYNVIGYLSGPISLGSVAPKKRIFGLVVYLVITFFLSTLGAPTLLPTAWSLTILMLIYMLINRKSHALKDVLFFTLPTGIYIWMLYFSLPLWLLLPLAACIYGLITSTRFVQHCKAKEVLVPEGS